MKQRKVKHVHVKGSIYNGTILEGLPINFKWNRKRPEITYDVTDNGINMYSYKSWKDIEEHHTLRQLQAMFLHDTSHALLYVERGENDKVFKKDFGLSWESSTQTKPINFWKSYPEFLDELKIVALCYILDDLIDNKLIQPKKFYIEHVVDITKGMHLDGEDLKDKNAHIRKRSMVASAVSYWFKEDRIAKLPQTVKKLTDIINEQYKKASD